MIRFHVVAGSNLYHEWMALAPEGYKIAAGDSLAAVLPAVLRYGAESLIPMGAPWVAVVNYGNGGERRILTPEDCRGIVAEARPGRGDPAYLEG